MSYMGWSGHLPGLETKPGTLIMGLLTDKGHPAATAGLAGTGSGALGHGAT